MIFLLFCTGVAFGYFVGYTYGWHSANGNIEVTTPKSIEKIWK